jgi:hypothetical protein
MALRLDASDPVLALFGETNGCLLVEVAPQHAEAFTAGFDNLPIRMLGVVTAALELSISIADQPLLQLPVDALVAAWNTEQ